MEDGYWPGEHGLLLLEYVGRSRKPRTWRGLGTDYPYRFGPGDVKYVDQRDALKFLTIPGEWKAFRLYRDSS